MSYPNPLGIAKGRNFRMKLAWWLGVLILLGWASPLKGQEASPPPEATSPQQTTNAFWPLSPNEVSSPSKASATPNRAKPSSSPAPTEEAPTNPNSATGPQTDSEGEPSTVPNASSSASDPKDASLPKAPEKPQLDLFPTKSAEPVSGVSGGGLPARPNRIREGTRISQQKGTFLLAGDRVVFSAQDKTFPKLVVLENLNLQRVLQMLQTSAQEELWVVTGRVTEFQGLNYLLLERAVRIDEADLDQAPPAPVANSAPSSPIPPASEKAPPSPVSLPSAPGQ